MSKRQHTGSRGRPREIDDDAVRVTIHVPAVMYAQIRGMVEVRKALAYEVGETDSTISIRSELERGWTEFWRRLPAKLRNRITRSDKYKEFAP